MKVKLGNPHPIPHVLVDERRRSEVRLVGRGKGGFLVLGAEEVDDVDRRVVVEELFEMA